jgi:hypothetical protein
VLPTVSFPVVRFNPIQQPLMVVGVVPKAGARVRALLSYAIAKKIVTRTDEALIALLTVF